MLARRALCLDRVVHAAMLRDWVTSDAPSPHVLNRAVRWEAPTGEAAQLREWVAMNSKSDADSLTGPGKLAGTMPASSMPRSLASEPPAATVIAVKRARRPQVVVQARDPVVDRAAAPPAPPPSATEAPAPATTVLSGSSKKRKVVLLGLAARQAAK